MPDNKNKQNVLLKGTCSGTSILIEMGTLGLFLENIKLEKQRTSRPYPLIVKDLLNQGLRGYWSGFIPWGVILGFTKGFVLGYSKNTFDNIYSKHYDPYTTNLLAGISAGGVQGAFMSPLTLCRVRVNQYMMNRINLQSKLKTSLIDEIKISTKILKNDYKKKGIMAFTTGMPIMIFKRSIDWGTRFFFINQFHHIIKKYNKDDNYKLSTFEKIYSAYISGMLSVAIAQPIDRIIPMIQEKNTSSINNNTGILNKIIKKIQKEGIVTMYRGWGVRSILTGWHTMFAIVVSEKLFNQVNKLSDRYHQQYLEFNDIKENEIEILDNQTKSLR
jgi:hypothetical protein